MEVEEQDPDTIMTRAFYPWFTGHRDQVVEWLGNTDPTEYVVCLGETAAIISAAAYMRLYGAKHGQS